MARSSTRAKKFPVSDEKIVRERDPEADSTGSRDDSDGESGEDVKAGTEHYLPVGKSALRQREGVSLGPQYRGSRVNRSALEKDGDTAGEVEGADEGSESDGSAGEEYDDPDEADLAADEERAGDSEIDSENALAESDAERFEGFTFRGSSQRGVSKRGREGRGLGGELQPSSSQDEGDGSDSEQGNVNGAGREASDDDDGDDDEDEDDDDDDDDDEEEEESNSNGRQGSGTFEAGSTGSAPHSKGSAKDADLKKGLAIQEQRKLYDGLLNLRIRLQKALVAANTLPTIDGNLELEGEAYEAAEEAAVKLLNTMEGLRQGFSGHGKRKAEFSVDMSSERIWEQLEEEEHGSFKFRESRLEKWWRRVQSVNVMEKRGEAGSRKGMGLVEALEEQLARPEGRLVKRTRVARSCAPVQAAGKAGEEEEMMVYDDADFYQLLLKELVDQRTVETAAGQGSGLARVMLRAGSEAKGRKQVDRRASKGRKMRFVVHEKLQNLMAAEDRRSWDQRAIDRLFGAMFGRRAALEEEEEEEEGEEEQDGGEGWWADGMGGPEAEATLRLFGR